jgi:LmbE family N-acetylglucosaminyl deacetylase
MLGLTLAPPPRKHLEVLCIGAHCDDIEIGCGGTVLALQRLSSACRVHWLVLTSVAARRKEALSSAKAFVGGRSRGECRIFDLPDGFLPAHFEEAKNRFEELKKLVEPDLVFTHHVHDAHQDHRLVSQLTWQTFRDHQIWEYEIPKFDGDLVTPNMYVPLPSALAARKVAVVMRTFRTQHGKPWFKAENLEAIMRLRGLECRAGSGFAEGFHCRKLVAAPAESSR